MSLTVITNIASTEASLRVYYNGVQRLEQATVIATVTGLDDGSSSAPATMLARALVAVIQKYPSYTRYEGAQSAVVMGYQAMGINESDNSAKIAISYETPTVNPNGNVNLVISDDTSRENDTTQFFRDDINGTITQLILKYVDPTNNKITKTATGTINSKRTIRRIVMSGTVLGQNLDQYRAAVGCTNDAKWFGLPPYFWEVTGWRNDTSDLGRTYQVQVTLSADTRKDVSKYMVGKDRNTGQIITVRGNDLLGLQKKKYQYGVICPQGVDITKNTSGIIRICDLLPIHFQSLFGVH